MRATIDWSYELLSEPEQRLFERLSVFAGGCTLATATAILDDKSGGEADVLGLLSSLVDKSMLVADLEPTHPRYRLLESFREYARQKLEARGDARSVAHRHAIIFADMAAELDEAWDTAPDALLAQAHSELGNWRSALEWALAARGDILLGQRLAGSLDYMWTYFSGLEGRRWVAVALALADERTPHVALANLWFSEAWNSKHLFELEAQLANSERALALYEDLNDEFGIARAQSFAAHALVEFGRVAEAEPLLQCALTTARKRGTSRLLAYVFQVVAMTRSVEGDFSAARSNLVESVAIYRTVGAELIAAVTMGTDVVENEFRAGAPERALSHAADALGALRAANHVRWVVELLSNMSACLVSLARYDEAEACAREVLDASRDQQLDVFTTRALQHLAAVEALRPQATVERRLDAHRLAARLLGFVEARLGSLGSPQGPLGAWAHDQVSAVLREAIPRGVLTSLTAEGAAMTEDQAIDAALA